MNTEDTLLAYSEWLDSQGLIVPEDDGAADRGRVAGDKRSHEDLAREFIEHWEAPATRAPLVGREVDEIGLPGAREFIEFGRSGGGLDEFGRSGGGLGL